MSIYDYLQRLRFRSTPRFESCGPRASHRRRETDIGCPQAHQPDGLRTRLGAWRCSAGAAPSTGSWALGASRRSRSRLSYCRSYVSNLLLVFRDVDFFGRLLVFCVDCSLWWRSFLLSARVVIKSCYCCFFFCGVFDVSRFRELLAQLMFFVSEFWFLIGFECFVSY